MSTERRIQELGIVLPAGVGPAGNYANTVRSGNLLFVSAKGPAPVNAAPPKGKLGREFSVDDGYRFARSAGLELIAAVRNALGSLDRVARVVEVQGLVNATPEFEEHPKVLDGCSDLLVEVFGARGLHARSVAGATSLRGGLPVVVRAIFEVEP